MLKESNSQQNLENAIRQMLKRFQLDEETQINTPNRVVRAFQELTFGYSLTADDAIQQGIFESNSESLVVVKDIDITSTCEHHLLPFFGKCHIGYLPNGKILGLSKFKRVVDIFARRFQVQERLGEQIADALCSRLQAKGVIVVIDAVHTCARVRGVNQAAFTTMTIAKKGVFYNDKGLVSEVLSNMHAVPRL